MIQPSACLSWQPDQGAQPCTDAAAPTPLGGTGSFVADTRGIGVTPHVAQNITAYCGSNIDGRTTRHPGYRLSQVIRKRIEEANGWIKEVGGMAQTKLRGVERVDWVFVFKAAAYNLIRLPKLLATG